MKIDSDKFWGFHNGSKVNDSIINGWLQKVYLELCENKDSTYISSGDTMVSGIKYENNRFDLWVITSEGYSEFSSLNLPDSFKMGDPLEFYFKRHMVFK